MNGFLNTGLEFWQVVVAVVTAVLSFVVIRVGVNFDLNKYLERKDKRNIQKLKNACTHLEMVPAENGQFQIRSLFESPPGTHQWQCQRCGLIRNHDNDYKERGEYYANHPDEYIKLNKKFNKLLKKSRLV